MEEKLWRGKILNNVQKRQDMFAQFKDSIYLSFIMAGRSLQYLIFCKPIALCSIRRMTWASSYNQEVEKKDPITAG